MSVNKYIEAEEILDLDETYLTITIREDSYSDVLIYLTDEGAIKLNIKKQDVHRLKSKIQSSFNSLIKKIQQGLVYDDLPKILLEDQTGLAYIGHIILNQIFAGEGLTYLHKKLDKPNINHQMGEQTEEKTNVLIINSDVMNIPWECLFLNPSHQFEKDIELEKIIRNFLGFGFAIARQDSQRVSNSTVNSDSKKLGQDSINIGVAFNHSLQFVQTEKAYFQELNQAQNSDIYVKEFECQSRFIIEFNDFLHDKQMDILHIACHGKTNENGADSVLEFSPANIFNTFDLSYSPKIIQANLVFLNACLTGIDLPLETINFVHGFRDIKGVENVIVTEGLIDSQVSAEFAVTFYQLLFKGVPLVKALHNARWSIIKKGDRAKVIAVMLYSFYGNPFFSL